MKCLLIPLIDRPFVASVTRWSPSFKLDDINISLHRQTNAARYVISGFTAEEERVIAEHSAYLQDPRRQGSRDSLGQNADD